MSNLKSPKSRSHLYSSIIGLILVAIGTYSFVLAYNSKNDFQIFLRVVLLIMFIIYAINNTVLYLKQKRL